MSHGSPTSRPGDHWWAVGAVWAACLVLPSAALAGEEGPMSLSPATLLADEMAMTEMAGAAPEAGGQDAPAPESPTTQPAEEAASAAWPPGIMQDALGFIGLKKPMDDLGLRVWGHVQTSFTGRVYGGPSRHQGPPRAALFLRGFDGHDFNNLQLNQLKLTFDRPMDTSKPFFLGGRFEFLFGSDARNIHSYGLTDGHSIYGNPPFANPHNPWPFNRREHFDIVQMYGEAWIKTGENGQGLDIMFGKFVTPIGAEVIDATGNYLISRSMLFTYAEPGTHTGLKLTYNFNPTNNVYFAAVRGWDVFKDNNKGASWISGFLWSSQALCGANPRTSFALNAIVGPEQFSSPKFSGRTAWHDDPGTRFLLDLIWTYRYTEKLTQVVNFDFGYEDNVPNAVNNEGVARRRDSDWMGLAYYLNYVFNDYVSATGRAEWFRDHYGVRTGFQGDFYEITTGLTVTPFPKDKYLKNLQFRPELRWDWSANNAPFHGHGNNDPMQMTAAIDMIYKF